MKKEYLAPEALVEMLTIIDVINAEEDDEEIDMNTSVLALV